MKLHKTILGAAAALMTIGLLASCQNAASPAKVTNVKAAELECADGTAVTKEQAEDIAKEMLGGVSGSVLSVKGPELTKVELAKAIYNVVEAAAATSEDKDPFETITKAIEQFEKDLAANKSATLSLNESVALDEEDEDFGTIDGSVSVKASAKATDDSVVLEGKYAYTASGNATFKANVSTKAKEKDAPVTAAKANVISKAEVKGFSVSVNTADLLAGKDGAMTLKGSAAGSVSTSAGVAFNEEGVVGKVIVNLKLGAKIDSAKIEDLIKKYMSGKDIEEEALKLAEDLITASADIAVYTPSNESVFSKSFDSVKAIETWLK